jgi:hypothetical protein
VTQERSAHGTEPHLRAVYQQVDGDSVVDFNAEYATLGSDINVFFLEWNRKLTGFGQKHATDLGSVRLSAGPLNFFLNETVELIRMVEGRHSLH